MLHKLKSGELFSRQIGRFQISSLLGTQNHDKFYKSFHQLRGRSCLDFCKHLESRLDVLNKGPNRPRPILGYRDQTFSGKLRKYLSFSGLERTDSRRRNLKRKNSTNEMRMATNCGRKTLESLAFDNKVLRDLPVDDSIDPRVQRQVHGACFTSVHQSPLENPHAVALSLEALDLIDVSEEEAARGEFPEYFSGSEQLPNSKPAAHCYCGHQFGYFSGQLGDGAAM